MVEVESDFVSEEAFRILVVLSFDLEEDLFFVQGLLRQMQSMDG